MRTYDEASWLWLCRYAFDRAIEIGGCAIPPPVVFGGRRRMGRELTVLREKVVCHLRKNVVTKEYRNGEGTIIAFSLADNVPDWVDADYVALSQPIIAELMGYRDHSAVNLILRKHGMGVRNQPMDAGALAEIRAGRPLDDGEI